MQRDSPRIMALHRPGRKRKVNAVNHRVQSASAMTTWPAAIFSCALLLGCAQASAPMQAPQAPKPAVSYINIPITIQLDSMEKAADAAVQRSIGIQPFEKALNGGSSAPSCGEDVGYLIERGPIALSGAGSVLTMTTGLNYWLKARKLVPCPGASISAWCGTEGEAPRTASVAIDSEITILPSLATSVHSTMRHAIAGTRCIMQPTGADITEPLMAAFDTTLAQMLPAFDEHVSTALDLRTRVQAAWERMSEPREVRPQVWLTWNPEAIGIVPVTVADGVLH